MPVSVIIPALNEADTIGSVLAGLANEGIDQVIVVDGGSSDGTVQIASDSGALVVIESRRGYGYACETGLVHAVGDVVVFMDADGANPPSQLPQLVNPVLEEGAQMVLGSRLQGKIAAGAMPWHQQLGNRFSAWLIQLLYGYRLTDLGPFRAVDRQHLIELEVEDKTYGWPTEMLVKAILSGWSIKEIPVDTHPRAGGESKISGTVRGSILATWHILAIIFGNKIWQS